MPNWSGVGGGWPPRCGAAPRAAFPLAGQHEREVTNATACAVAGTPVARACASPSGSAPGPHRPQPGYGFKYTTASYSAVLSSVLEALEVSSATVVVQGWLGASHGLPFALRTLRPAGALRSLFILNAPLPPSSPSLPLAARLWRLPGMLGDIFTQDAMSVERVLEKGGPYLLDLPDANTYRRPMMLSGDAGFALGGAVRACPLDPAADGVADDLRAWTEEAGGAVEVAWGVKDKYLGRDVAERFGAELCPSATVGFVEGAGHYTAEDFGERVGERLVQFLRRTDPV